MLKRKAKTASVDKLTAEIAETAAIIEKMGKKIKTLIEEQAALTKAMAEATEQREAEKAENEATIADAVAGEKAVAQANEILQEFYASEGATLVQVGRQVPEMAEYKGLHAEKKGIVGMLEVIQTDFIRLNTETTAAEKLAANEYDKYMEDAKESKLQKHNLEVKTKLDKDQKEFEK